MKSFLGILASLPALAMLVALASPASAQADPFAEHRAKAERLCNDLKQQAKDLAGRAEKLPDPKVRAEAAGLTVVMDKCPKIVLGESRDPVASS